MRLNFTFAMNVAKPMLMLASRRGDQVSYGVMAEFSIHLKTQGSKVRKVSPRSNGPRGAPVPPLQRWKQLRIRSMYQLSGASG